MYICTGQEPNYSLTEIKEIKTLEVANKAEEFLAPYKLEYCSTERDTWDQQYSEALAYIANPLEEVPLLAAIALARGQSISDLASAIINNRQEWILLAGKIIGQRLAYQDIIDSTNDVNILKSMNITYSL